MDSTADDNFFIEEPHKLGNNFFNKDKTLQIVELLAQKHHHEKTTPVTKQQKAQQLHPFSISFLMKKPELKSNSAEHLNQLLRKVQQTLDYRDSKSIDWLSVALDDHFVELVKTDDAVDIIDQLGAYVDSQCALLREIENTKCLLKPIAEILDSQQLTRKETKNNPPKETSPTSSKQSKQQQTARHRIFHRVDYIEF